MKTNAWSSRLRRVALVGALALATAFAPLVVAPAPAQAAPVTGFNPGNIISDSLFYNGNAMTASEVQAFLNQRIAATLDGRCTIGDPGRAAGSAWGNTRIASKCLRNFSMNTTTKAANANCAAYTGRSGETAAEIITRVGQACGISQKVLLVMLEKEQSLVSDTWPTVRQFDVAMGYACPDSGPGNSANCDMTYAGFFNQVYLSAWQLKNYRLYSHTFAYKPFQNNSIQWHPNASCGRSTVYIENWATAALYIYTPYRPNQAALNAGWGEGDGCSSYGNRNFYLMYTTWFGTAQGGPRYEIPGDMLGYWNANQGWLGQPTGAAVSVPGGGGGRLQYFDGGYVYQSNAGSPVGFVTSSPIIRAFGAAGGIEGSWGWPLAPAVSYGPGSGVVRFKGGAVVEVAGSGVYLVPEASRAKWESSGGFQGSLGPPTGAAVALGAAGAIVQGFQKGDLYSSSLGAAILPNGAIRDAYAAAGGSNGAWGLPIGDAVCVPEGQNCIGYFAQGVATVTPEFGLLFTRQEQGASPAELVNPPGSAAQRISGADRFATAVEASRHGFPDSAAVQTVIVANGLNYPDALSAAALGVKMSAPLLLTETGALPAATIGEIQRLAPQKIVVIGGEGVVNGAVFGQLRSLVGADDTRIERVFGADRYSTSLAIAEYGWSESGGAGGAFLATGADFADALAAGAAAGKLGAPVILVAGTEANLSPAVQDSLGSLAVNKVYLVGGSGVISNGIQSTLAAGWELVRFAGADRYATSAEVVKGVFGTRADVYLANGEGFADALTGSVIAGVRGVPLILATQNCVPSASYEAFDQVAGAKSYLLGGVGSLSLGVQHGNECVNRSEGMSESELNAVRALYSKVNSARFDAGLSGYRFSGASGRFASAFTFATSVNAGNPVEDVWSRWMNDSRASQEILRPFNGPKPKLGIRLTTTGATSQATLYAGFDY